MGFRHQRASDARQASTILPARPRLCCERSGTSPDWQCTAASAHMTVITYSSRGTPQVSYLFIDAAYLRGVLSDYSKKL